MLVWAILADLYLEGVDQHRGWFQSSLLISTAVNEQAPYKGVLTHGFVVDEKGHKVSKSMGNGEDAITLINRYGADTMRLWVITSDYPLPWKIVHPKHPSFNINLFKISDYQENNQQLANALNCLFPVGTPKADVDKIMVGIAGAEVYPNIKSNKKLVEENEYFYKYTSAKIKFFHKYYPINNVYKILVIKYDKNNRLEFSPFVIYGRCVDGDINAK